MVARRRSLSLEASINPWIPNAGTAMLRSVLPTSRGLMASAFAARNVRRSLCRGWRSR